MTSGTMAEDLPEDLLRAIEEIRGAQDRCRDAGIEEERLVNALLSEAVRGLVLLFGASRSARMLCSMAELVQQPPVEHRPH